MKDKSIKSKNSDNNTLSFVFALIVAIATPVISFVPIYIIEYSQLSDFALFLIESLIMIILTSIPCFFICRKNPSSVRYVPLIANIGILLMAYGGLTNHWSITERILLVTISVLITYFLSLMGAGKPIITEQDN